jgi:hypothetical protein
MAIIVVFATCMGISYHFDKSQQDGTLKIDSSRDDQTNEQASSTDHAKKSVMEKIASILVLAIPLITAIIQLIPAISPYFDVWLKKP